jgi:hypothetical protein
MGRDAVGPAMSAVPGTRHCNRRRLRRRRHRRHRRHFLAERCRFLAARSNGSRSFRTAAPNKDNVTIYKTG